MNNKRDFRAQEAKWRPYWEAINLYRTGSDPDKPNRYVLDFFPYPSGAGLSVGHCRNYVPTCISSRFERMNGFNVLHPMGYDAFGLPAENYAIKHNVHPRISTARQGANYQRQMRLVECSYDWEREIYSTDPDYYRWTQWFFIMLFRRGLAYRAFGAQWWCPNCQTILANEQVENGRCWRCGSIVEKKDLEQWYFKITDYADRLLDGLETVDWPEPIKQMQRNWIGRSQGATIFFDTPAGTIDTFTTRPDTLFGVTYLAVAPEHELVPAITGAEQADAVNAYVAQARRQTEMDRQAVDRPKTGVFSGSYAAHPLTGTPLPIWIADYVLPTYGTGAVMGVPAHDERDHAFAETHGIPIVTVITPSDGSEPAGSYHEPGILVNSGAYSGQTSAAAITAMNADMTAAGWGRPEVRYKMRDWLISRQRYWGAPIPIVHCPDCGPVAVPEAELPVRLPDIDDFAPAGDGRSPLAKVSDWVNTTCPNCGGPAQRETDTMDGFACSSWYFLRFPDPTYADGPFNPEAVRAWLPVDVYVGGAEHAVMHLLYARFWTKVMYDAGLVHFDEPFQKLLNQGVLHAADGKRMSKSRGNVVTPDEVVAVHGTDALRTYVVFIGPFDASVNWDDANIVGVTRFLDRYWQLAGTAADRPEPDQTDAAAEAFCRQRQHETIKKITADMAAFKFNTAVAALMGWLNDLYGLPDKAIRPEIWREAIRAFTLALAPFAPFVTESVWQEVLGHADSVHRQSWPAFDEAFIGTAQIRLAVQVNGKVRAEIEVPAGSDQAAVAAAALAEPNVQRFINGAAVRRVVVVPERLVNIVVN